MYKDMNEALNGGATIANIDNARYRARQQRQEKPPRFKLEAFDDIILGKEPRDLIKGLFPATGIAVVWGKPKCGKSFWSYDALAHAALGWVYRGRKVQQGPVVYCSFEGHAGVPRRTEAFRKKFLQDHSDPVPLYTIRATLDLARDHKELIQDIGLQLAGQKPVAIALDTLNRSMTGSESSDEDMAAYLKAADAIKEAFDCLVIIIHHCGVSGDRPRGHTSLTGTVDAQLAVSRDAANNIVVEVEFMKDAEEGATIGSRLEVVDVGLDQDGDIITSCVVVSTEVVARAAGPIKGRPGVALKMLQKALDQAGEPAPASNQIPQNVRVVRVCLLEKYFYAGTFNESDKPETKKKAFTRACQRLQDLGIIQVWDEWVWLRTSPDK
jgi:hypothetical protein